MDTLAADYRNEALKLILFAERTEWEAKHRKLRPPNKASTSNDPNRWGNRLAEDTRVIGNDKDELTLPKEELRLKGQERYRHPLKLHDSERSDDRPQNSGHPEGQESKKLVEKHRNAKQHLAHQNLHEVKSEKSFKDGLKSKNSVKTDDRPVCTSEKADNENHINIRKNDLIKDALNNTNLVTTLLGGQDICSLPGATPVYHLDPTQQRQPFYRNTADILPPPPAVIPSTNYVNEIPIGHTTQHFGSSTYPYCIPNEQPTKPGIHYQQGAPGIIWNWPNFSQISQAQSTLPTTYYNQRRQENTHVAPTPNVKDRTLFDDKRGSQVVKPKKEKKPWTYEQAHINGSDQSTASEKKAKPKGKVIKKRPKALKRMDSIAKKYSL